MRLPNIAPDKLSDEQRPLFSTLENSIDKYLHGFVTKAGDGALIGPFNILLHFARIGKPAWDVFLALNENPKLPPLAREVVMLHTGARTGALYELYSHEAVAARAGLSASKIRTIAAGQRPPDLTEEEAIAYDVAAVLNRGAQVPKSLYDAAVEAFGIEAVSEIAFLVGCYSLICSLLNTFDVALPQTEGGAD